jgi:hypothetical protein
MHWYVALDAKLVALDVVGFGAVIVGVEEVVCPLNETVFHPPCPLCEMIDDGGGIWNIGGVDYLLGEVEFGCPIFYGEDELEGVVRACVGDGVEEPGGW